MYYQTTGHGFSRPFSALGQENLEGKLLMGSAVWGGGCFVSDPSTYTQRGEFLSLSIISVNTLHGVSTGYDLVFVRHIHGKNRIFPIPARCVFTQQGG